MNANSPYFKGTGYYYKRVFVISLLAISAGLGLGAIALLWGNVFTGINFDTGMHAVLGDKPDFDGAGSFAAIIPSMAGIILAALAYLAYREIEDPIKKDAYAVSKARDIVRLHLDALAASYNVARRKSRIENKPVLESIVGRAKSAKYEIEKAFFESDLMRAMLQTGNEMIDKRAIGDVNRLLSLLENISAITLNRIEEKDEVDAGQSNAKFLEMDLVMISELGGLALRIEEDLSVLGDISNIEMILRNFEQYRLSRHDEFLFLKNEFDNRGSIKGRNPVSKMEMRSDLEELFLPSLCKKNPEPPASLCIRVNAYDEEEYANWVSAIVKEVASRNGKVFKDLTSIKDSDRIEMSRSEIDSGIGCLVIDAKNAKNENDLLKMQLDTLSKLPHSVLVIDGFPHSYLSQDYEFAHSLKLFLDERKLRFYGNEVELDNCLVLLIRYHDDGADELKSVLEYEQNIVTYVHTYTVMYP